MDLRLPLVFQIVIRNPGSKESSVDTFVRPLSEAEAFLHSGTIARGRQRQLRLAQDLQFVLRYTLGIAPFSNHMERTVVLDMLLPLAPCDHGGK